MCSRDHKKEKRQWKEKCSEVIYLISLSTLLGTNLLYSKVLALSPRMSRKTPFIGAAISIGKWCLLVNGAIPSLSLCKSTVTSSCFYLDVVTNEVDPLPF